MPRSSTTFAPGHPGAKPKGAIGAVKKAAKELAQVHAGLAIDTLVKVCRGEVHPSLAGAATSAAVALLDRGFGKPSRELSVQANIRPFFIGPLEPISQDPEEWAEKVREIEARRQAQLQAQRQPEIRAVPVLVYAYPA
ncbi:MAG: hypothetical protein WBX25_10980 [Rhodomicrobium sp.]